MVLMSYTLSLESSSEGVGYEVWRVAVVNGLDGEGTGDFGEIRDV